MVKIRIRTPKGVIESKISGKKVEEDYEGFRGKECHKLGDILHEKMLTQKEIEQLEEKPEASIEVEEGESILT